MRAGKWKVIALVFVLPFIPGCEAYWNSVIFGIRDTGWDLVGSPSVVSGVNDARLFLCDGEPLVVYSTLNGFESTIGVSTYSEGSWQVSAQAETVDDVIMNMIIAQDPVNDDLYLAVREGAGNVGVMRYSDGVWNDLPTVSGTAYVIPLAVAANAADDIYLAYSVSGEPVNGMTVVWYNGFSWIVLGLENEFPESVSFASISTNDSGQVFLSYDYLTDTNNLAVHSWNGASWDLIGDDLTEGNAYGVASCSPAEDTLFVAYTDAAYGRETIVKQYNGASWSTVGPAGISGGMAGVPRIAVSPTGVLHVVFTDESTEGEAVLLIWNDASWEAVGSRGFSYGDAAEQLDLAFAADGTPYVSYIARGHLDTLTVMKRR